MFDFREKYDLKRVSENELWDLRVKMIPMILVKYDKKLFITENVKEFSHMLFDVKKKHEHLCNFCKKMSGNPTNLGGCDKTHDIFTPFPYNRNVKSLKDISEDDLYDPYIKSTEESELEKALRNLKDSCRIEKYQEITFGIELLTRACQRCIILNCTHFDEYDSRK